MEYLSNWKTVQLQCTTFYLLYDFGLTMYLEFFYLNLDWTVLCGRFGQLQGIDLESVEPSIRAGSLWTYNITFIIYHDYQWFHILTLDFMYCLITLYLDVKASSFIFFWLGFEIWDGVLDLLLSFMSQKWKENMLY